MQASCVTGRLVMGHSQGQRAPRQMLSELRVALFRSGRLARDGVHVRDFRAAVGPPSSAGKNAASARDTLVHAPSAKRKVPSS